MRKSENDMHQTDGSRATETSEGVVANCAFLEKTNFLGKPIAQFTHTHLITSLV